VARFDWYQATIPAGVNDVLEVLGSMEDGFTLSQSKGHHGYAHETRVEGPQGTIGRVWHGGCHELPHAVLSGEMAQPGAELIRVHWPDHKVSRLDACEDFADPVFDQIQGAMLEVAERRKIKVDTRGDHLLTKVGRTVMLGAASSHTRVRLYDKAAELRAKFAADPVRLATVPQHLVRFEAQVRPQTNSAKQAFASIEPMDVMGSAQWLREVWAKVAGIEVTPVQVGKSWRQADDDRAYAYLLSQYGALLQRMHGTHGDWACVGLQIGHDLAERRKAQGR
jgi:hypothetical protein